MTHRNRGTTKIKIPVSATAKGSDPQPDTGTTFQLFTSPRATEGMTISGENYMERYDYLEQLTSDVKDAILEKFDMNEIAVELERRDSFEQELYDRLFCEDSVTGNASGSYYCNAWKAEEALAHNLDLLADAIEELGGCLDPLKDGAEACDVTIRCYLLPQAISAALDELEEDLEEEGGCDE